MLERVVVALDGTPESEAILTEVERVVGPRTAIDLLHVLRRRPREVPGAGRMEQKPARRYLERVALRFSDRQTALHLRRGDPRLEIPRAARTLGADLLALLAPARGGFARHWPGSVAEGVIRRSSVPLLLARPHQARPRRPLGRILVPVDGSEPSKQVFETVRRLVGNRAIDVVVLHVAPTLISDDPLSSAAPIGRAAPAPDPTSSRRADADALEREGLKARALVVFGAAADQILEQARLLDVDLIAMASARRTGLSKAFHRSISRRVLDLADRPVLLHRVPSGPEPVLEARSLFAEDLG